MAQPQPQLTEQQRQDIETSFKQFDKDGNGRISSSELAAVMAELGQTPTDEQIKAMIAEVDTNKNGTVELSEFLVMMSKTMGSGDMNMSENDISDAFKVFDKDGNGKITVSELQTAMEGMVGKVSKEEAEAMIKQADVDGDGMVNYNEFAAMMKQK